MKESLSPEEVIMAVVMHRDGAENQQIARWFGINQGRISEAIQAMEWASQNHMQIYKIVRGESYIATKRKTNEVVDAKSE